MLESGKSTDAGTRNSGGYRLIWSIICVPKSSVSFRQINTICMAPAIEGILKETAK